MSGADITLELSRQEALILFDWIASLDDAVGTPQRDDATQQVLWKIEGHLEKTLTEVLDPDYAETLNQAKRSVTGKA